MLLLKEAEDTLQIPHNNYQYQLCSVLSHVKYARVWAPLEDAQSEFSRLRQLLPTVCKLSFLKKNLKKIWKKNRQLLITDDLISDALQSRCSALQKGALVKCRTVFHHATTLNLLPYNPLLRLSEPKKLHDWLIEIVWSFLDKVYHSSKLWFSPL